MSPFIGSYCLSHAVFQISCKTSTQKLFFSNFDLMAKSSDFMLRFFFLSLSLASTFLSPESSDWNSDFLSHNLMSAIMRIFQPKIKRTMNLSYSLTLTLLLPYYFIRFCMKLGAGSITNDVDFFILSFWAIDFWVVYWLTLKEKNEWRLKVRYVLLTITKVRECESKKWEWDTWKLSCCTWPEVGQLKERERLVLEFLLQTWFCYRHSYLELWTWIQVESVSEGERKRRKGKERERESETQKDLTD